MPKAQEKLRKLYWADWTLKVVLSGLFLWYLMKFVEMVSNNFEVANSGTEIVENLTEVS